MKLTWSKHAIADRRHILEFIAQDNPPAAIRNDERISRQIEHLSRFPEMGRPGRLSGTRELVVSGTSWIVVYCKRGQDLFILRILHGRQMWP